MKRPLISIAGGLLVVLWIAFGAWAFGTTDLSHRGPALGSFVTLVPLCGLMVALLIFTCPFWEDSSK